MTSTTPPESPTRVSPLRVVLLVLVALAVVAAGFVGVRSWTSDADDTVAAPPSDDTLFAGYVDVTATPSYPFESPVSSSGDEVVLAFVVADHDEACEPTWGAAYSLEDADEELELGRRLTLLRVRGGDYTVSFGGAINDELATVCTDAGQLDAAYTAVVERYEADEVDFDLEGPALADRAANERRAAAVAALQSAREADGADLAVWLTLPAATAGLTADGVATVSEFLDAGVDLAGVNAMTMNYGESRTSDQTMVEATEQTLEAVHAQLGDAYEASGESLDDDALWAKVAMTPMIGQNDVAEDVLTVEDARQLNDYARSTGLGRVSMWSLNRDASCGVNYITVTIVSDACSGVDQGAELFADVFSTPLDPDAPAPEPAPVAAVGEPLTPADLVDDPATSPYDIWQKDRVYLAGTKVVWHRTVYEAKWWTSGNLPDDPAQAEWETPWRLLGPVLPGEKPIPTPTVAPGTYPRWSSTEIYLRGDRVVLRGVPYRAKWWNQGESPEVAETNPDATPWATFTPTEVRLINERAARG